ncbi:efflux RND transporter periplasmic adaptor subunit [Nitrospirillum viridazoti]|uniref:Efflux transporter periplasmic adaptor subunit n=1 Tax=Nitrospirillum viridazoti CBAmc TaxID=1441467 RepID=A0A248JVA8_9PROT|nr:efflux RND transporter periplasmic adaptor subunit [Nitrospirillum amazonense]ASG22421.1 efflux transporter periplasmic adaptor subunit [Nitrospirillum amazonense CBAmc]TWB43038.1 RND family efflux transporter MFP subunit [Nitrospirillum amazonense]
MRHPVSSRLLTLAVLALAGTSLSACDKPAPDPRTAERLVRVATAQPAARDERAYVGVVTAKVQSGLGFRVAGKVTQRLVDPGQTVKAGQPLMRMDNTDYAHAITTQQGQVAMIKATLTQARADEARYRALVGNGAVSPSAYDQKKAAADGAQAQLDAALAQLRVAQDDSAYTTLVADADGTVMDTLAEPGQVVAAGQIVVRLAHAGPREAAVNLPETVRPAVGSHATATLYGSAVRAPATLRQLSDAADTQTRTYEARYVLDGAAAQAPLGATVTVRLSQTGDDTPPVSVPLGALNDEGKGPGVWVLTPEASGDKATIAFRPVTVGQLGAEEATLLGGVKAGERVVALGGHFLHEGEKVRVAQNAAPAQAVLK